MQRPVVLNLRTGLDETLCIDATLPRSHSVLGSAPVIMNTCWMSRVSLPPVLALCKSNPLKVRVAFEHFDCGPRWPEITVQRGAYSCPGPRQRVPKPSATLQGSWRRLAVSTNFVRPTPIIQRMNLPHGSRSRTSAWTSATLATPAA